MQCHILKSKQYTLTCRTIFEEFTQSVFLALGLLLSKLKDIQSTHGK